jgi:phage tail sheath protein FI
MPEFFAPGVFVEEIGGGARPISAVGTATAALLGRASDPGAPLRKPLMISSFAEFVLVFSASAPRAGSTLANAAAGFFANGGSRLYVVNLGPKASALNSDDLLLLDALDDVSLVAAPEFTDAASHEALIADCERRGDRFAVLDAPEIIDPLERLTRQAVPGEEGPDAGLRPRMTEQGCAALYAPWIVIRDTITGERASQPPSGHIIGLYAQNDARRGVHKAPANMTVRGALDLVRKITEAEQALLNPAGVNCIRRFPDGIRVWGARTLAGPTSEWRYVAVRRLVTMIAQSVELGTRWAVFEPNDDLLWNALRRDVGAFLNQLWRDGALLGATPDEAYFVRCDRTTMTQADIDAGRVVVLIGVAVAKSGEFLMIRCAQSVGDVGGG